MFPSLARAVLLSRGPGEVVATVGARELLDVAGVLLDAGGRAMELEEERGRLGVRELLVRVDRAHHRGVQQLAARDRHARLDDGDRGADRVLGGREGADGGGDRLGDRPQPQRELGDDPERPLRADEQVGEVVARALGTIAPMVIFTSGGSEANNLALKGARVERLIVSAVEHPSVLESARASGKPVDVLPVDGEGVADLDRLLDALEDNVLRELERRGGRYERVF